MKHEAVIRYETLVRYMSEDAAQKCLLRDTKLRHYTRQGIPAEQAAEFVARDERAERA